MAEPKMWQEPKKMYENSDSMSSLKSRTELSIKWSYLP